MLAVATAALGLQSARPTLARVAAAPSSSRTAVAELRMAAKDDVCVDELCSTADFYEMEDEIDAIKKAQGVVAAGNSYAEQSRQYRRTVYMHDEWVKHRSSERFIKNMATIADSGVAVQLRSELSIVTTTAVLAVLVNMLLGEYQDLSGAMHPGPLSAFALPFSVCMPALSLLLVFRTNTAYSRWNEARTLWGGVVNTCRNVVRQANLYYDESEAGEEHKERVAAQTAAFSKGLRNFLRGPTDDAVYRAELDRMVDADLITDEQVDACMAAKNRPMYCIGAMSHNLRVAGVEPMGRARMDTSLQTLVDLTGACERIFKSPVPLVYTRHTSRFLTTFLLFLPFGLWPLFASSWNHVATVPATAIIGFFLLGIEEIGIQIEEPFSILPLEALCDGAIGATMDELVQAPRAG